MRLDWIRANATWNYTEIGKRAWLFAKLKPKRARKRMAYGFWYMVW